MKYNINLNLLKMQEHSLNVNQWCILDIISIAPTWCEIIVFKEEPYYWISRTKILEELKALDLKEDTVYRHLKTLKEMGFIYYEKDNKKDLIKLTELGKSLFVYSEINPNNNQNSEINPTKLGNKSENNSEINPTYNNTSINNKTKDNEIAIPSCIEKNSWNEWVSFRKQIKKTLTDLTIKKQIKFLVDCFNKGQNPNLIIEQSIANGWTGLFELKSNSKQSYKDRCINESDRVYEAPLDAARPF